MKKEYATNLRFAEGKVPVISGKETILIDFPTKEVFFGLFHKSIPDTTLQKYWDILNQRRAGATLADSGKPFGLTRERVRQIEAKFIRIMTKNLSSSVGSSMPDSL